MGGHKNRYMLRVIGAHLLARWIKLCWDRRWMPNQWRIARVVLIHKGGEAGYWTNYRPTGQ